MAENPSRGLACVAAASTALSTALSHIDGGAGRLPQHGHDISEPAGTATSLDVR